jgi:hypothetical protein
MPAITLVLAKLGTAMPWLQELLRPALERRGARVKAAYRARAGHVYQKKGRLLF